MNKSGLIVSVVLACTSCGEAKQLNPQAVSYGVELMQCVDKAKTKEESQACRKEVDKKYGQCDGGVCQ